jgi:hypothetical protein
MPSIHRTMSAPHTMSTSSLCGRSPQTLENLRAVKTLVWVEFWFASCGVCRHIGAWSTRVGHCSATVKRGVRTTPAPVFVNGPSSERVDV